MIDAAPEVVLGRPSVRAFGPELPFLMKVLTAARPLSIQAHPTRALAEEGFAREEAAGIPRLAPERNYRDRNHKPELIIALGEFFALDGFRPAAEIAASWRSTPELAPLLDAAAGTDAAGAAAGDEAAWLQRLFERCMRDAAAAIALHALVERLSREARDRPWPRDRVEHWLLAAAREYARPGAPGNIDRGLFAFLLLNFVRLAPGQALYLGAGRLHAYLEGAGIEVMASSDNVLRGGLTPKHVDVPELLRVLTFKGAPAQILVPDARGVYKTPAAEFEVASLTVSPTARHRSEGASGATLLLVVEGEAQVTAGRHRLALPAGQPALIPAALAAAYEIEAASDGPARLFRVCVPSTP